MEQLRENTYSLAPMSVVTLAAASGNTPSLSNDVGSPKDLARAEIRAKAVRVVILAVIGLVAALALLPAASASAAVTPITLGKGSVPGVAVDANGTAHVAWHPDVNGDAPLKYCKVSRGARTCDGGGPRN